MNEDEWIAMKRSNWPGKNPSAVALGRLGKGIKKTLSPEQRAAQAERVAKAREKLAEMRRKER